MKRNPAFCVLAILLIINVPSLKGQIVVEWVIFEEDESSSKIPHLIDKGNERNEVIEKINLSLLDCFMIESFDPKEVEDFRWSELDFKSEIRSDIFYLYFSGTYYSAYPNYVTEVSYYDLHTGEQIPHHDPPFQSLFTLDGYFDFLNQYWMKGVNGAFNEAIKCADSEPYCSIYDVNYSIENQKLTASLIDDCYARVVRACSPEFSVSVDLDELNPILNEFAKKEIIGGKYYSKQGVERLLAYRELSKKIPNNVYLFGKIDGKYAFSMALNFANESNALSGFYYYNNKLQKIKLSGQENENSLDIKETFEGKVTGVYHLNWDRHYSDEKLSIYNPYGESTYLSGSWTNGDGTRKFPIEFTSIIFNDRD